MILRTFTPNYTTINTDEATLRFYTSNVLPASPYNFNRTFEVKRLEFDFYFRDGSNRQYRPDNWFARIQARLNGNIIKNDLYNQAVPMINAGPGVVYDLGDGVLLDGFTNFDNVFASFNYPTAMVWTNAYFQIRMYCVS